MSKDASAEAKNIIALELAKSLVTTKSANSIDGNSDNSNKWLLLILIPLLSSIWIHLSDSILGDFVGGKDHLDWRTLKRLQQTTGFDAKELRQWHRDGNIGLARFKGIYRQFLPYGDPDDYAELVFGVFDIDRSGLIDFEKFIAALTVTSRGTVQEKSEWAFRLYDLNDDGMISEEEITTVVTAIYKVLEGQVQLPEDEMTPSMRVAKIFRAMNQDGDGLLSRDEFREGSERDPTIIEDVQWPGILRRLGR